MDRQRLLIIGTRGFLGARMAQTASDTFDVIRGDRGNSGHPESVELDIADADSVDRAFHHARPDAVLLLAAMSDIDLCETLPEKAFAVNAHGAENVANACVQFNARLLFTSSAAVFDGKKHSYHEEDPISPLSVYGKTKAWAENAVKTLLPSAVIVRFALVLGFARRSDTNSMLDKVIGQWKSGQPVLFPTRELRNPIDLSSLSNMLIHILANGRIGGIYHIGASDSVSRYELGKRLAARAGISTNLVLPQNDLMAGRAPRGENHFLLTEKIRKTYNFEVQTTDQVIERCFS